MLSRAWTERLAMSRFKEDQHMFSIRASVIATIAIVVTVHGVALAAKVDDPTTFAKTRQP
jgi:hypothetical protein